MARLNNPFYQFFDDAGNPLSFGKVFFYESGSNTLFLDTYSDSSLNNVNTNPQILDGEGRLGSTFLDGVYNVVLEDRNGVQIDALDPVGGDAGSRLAFAPWVSTTIYNKNNIVEGSDERFYISAIDNNLGNDPTTGQSSGWTRIQFIEDWIDIKTYEIDDIVIGTDFLFYRSTSAANQGNDPTTDGGVNWAILITFTAGAITYDNSSSGLSATTVQGAIDELADRDAQSISYDPECSGLPATDVQNAIDSIMDISQSELDRPLLYLPLTRDFNGIGKGNVNYTRTGAASYVDRYGTVIKVAADEPRFQGPEKVPGKNLILWSEDFTQSEWTKTVSGTGSLAVVTANAATAPDGTNTADQVFFDDGGGGTSGDISALNQSFVNGSVSQATVSIWVRSATGTDQTVKLFATNSSVDFETVVATNKWQRFEYSIANGDRLRIGLRGQATTADVYLWGGQGEEGSSATKYQQTTDTTDILTQGGLLVEQAATNFCLFSEQFDNAAWVSQAAGTGLAAVVTPNAGLAPDDTMTADQVVLDLNGGVTSGDLSGIRQLIGISTDTDYIPSIYIKSNTGADQAVALEFEGSTNIVTATVEWQRFSSPRSGTTPNFDFVVRARGTQTADVVDVLLWGAMLELEPSNGLPTSYIETTSTTETRGNDEPTVDYLDNGPLLSNEFSVTVFFNASKKEDLNYIFCLDNGAANDLFLPFALIRDNAGQELLIRYTNAAGSAQVNVTTTIELNKDYFLAYVFTGTELQLYLNGLFVSSQPVTTLSETSQNGLIGLGKSILSSARPYNGVLTDFRIYKRALQPQEVKHLAGLVEE